MHKQLKVAIGVLIVLVLAIVPVGAAAGWTVRSDHAGQQTSVYAQQMEAAINENYQVSIQQQSPSNSAAEQLALSARFESLTSQICDDAKIIGNPLPAGGALFVANYC
jgi:predicted negative regulator of RcsB-dependent stress response